MQRIVNPVKALELLCLASVVTGLVMVQAQPAEATSTSQPQSKTETVRDSGLQFPSSLGSPDRRRGAGSR